MPDLVYGRFALVVIGLGAVGHRPRQDVAAVEDVNCRRKHDQRVAVRHVVGHAAEAEQGAAGRHARSGEFGLEIHVQRVVGTLSQSVLHASIVGAVGPGVVDRISGADQAELNVCRRVRSVELGKLGKKRVG